MGIAAECVSARRYPEGCEEKNEGRLGFLSRGKTFREREGEREEGRPASEGHGRFGGTGGTEARLHGGVSRKGEK